MSAGGREAGQGAAARPQSAGEALAGLARAAAGALIFGLPLLMTMELWEFGATMDRLRLALLILVGFPLLVGIAHRIGFEATFGWREDVRDALIALGVAAAVSAGLLLLLAVPDGGAGSEAFVGQVAVQSAPAAIGALLARSQFGEAHAGTDTGAGAEEGPAGGDAPFSGWAGEMFLMLVGAIFLSLNVAPTEEMVLISYMMTPWHALAIVLVSLALMHGFVYAVGFRGGEGGAEDQAGWSGFFRYTLAGYVICLAISLYVLWTFGRLDGLGAPPAAMATVVLALPAAIGAAAARLIL